ncbi:MAG: hypothetical protein U1C19_03500 [Methanobacteriaceae archaeon]|nr:hypothetical protein [Methanobacteriaceae archaeon]
MIPSLGNTNKSSPSKNNLFTIPASGGTFLHALASKKRVLKVFLMIRTLKSENVIRDISFLHVL